MAVENTAHAYDGVLSTVTFTATDDDTATTSVNVIGQIVQCAINRSSGSATCTVTFTDTTNDCELFSKSSAAATDLLPDDINSGGGAYCRGPLKCTTTSASGALTQTFIVYYVKM